MNLYYRWLDSLIQTKELFLSSEHRALDALSSYGIAVNACKTQLNLISIEANAITSLDELIEFFNRLNVPDSYISLVNMIKDHTTEQSNL